MSSSTSAAVQQDDIVNNRPTTKTKSGNKKRRPTFRPASQRKSNRSAATSSSAAEIPPNDEVEKEPVISSSDQATPVASVSPSTDAAVTPESAGGTAKSPRRATGKKRKASTGVAIGSSRPIQEQEEEVLEDGVPVTQPSVLPEPSVPSALPGQTTLQAYCSRFRSKEKRQRTTSRTAPETTADAPQAETTVTTRGPVVQVVNGEIVLQESSMVVPGARRSVQEVEEEFQHVVEEESHTAVVGASYHSFVSRRAPQHWTVEETKLFYRALRQVGTDFGTMVAYFDNRSRKQLKRKYQMEHSKHPHLVALALNPKSKVPLDLSVFNVQVESSNLPSQPANKEQTSQQLKESQPSTTATQPRNPPVSVVNEPPEEGDVEALEAPDVEDPLFEEGETDEIDEDQRPAAASIPPLERTRDASTAKSKRPKFKANRTKSRAK